jgi:hypothetical protein
MRLAFLGGRVDTRAFTGASGVTARIASSKVCGTMNFIMLF